MRILGDILTLPYNWNQLQIGLNDFATADNFNAAIIKLDTNLQYLIEQTSLNNLSIAYSTTLIPLSSILTDSKEFHDAFVYNKALYKTLYNNFEFRNKLWGQFYTNSSSIVSIKYIFSSWLYTYQPCLNNYIGLNEILSTSVLNRCLNEIYKIQDELLRLEQEVPA